MAKVLKDKKIETVYIGGGTPTAIDSHLLEKIIKTINKEFNRIDIKEFTVEAGRPDTISEENLTMLKENHVSRISINPQTMNDETLDLIGRSHKVSDFLRAYDLAKKLAFDSINMDIIIGLPNEDIGSVRKTLEEIKSLDPDNLTVHTLAIKTGSEFKNSLRNYKLTDENTVRQMMEETSILAESMDLKAYYLYRQKQILANLENIGYGKIGKECIYNIAMMEEKQTIIGLGMGAVSKIYIPNQDRIFRLANFKSLRDYSLRMSEQVYNKEVHLDRL